jgi:hypothetical protein
LVQTLVEGELAAGNHTAVWDGSSTSSGIYLIRMQTASFSGIRKVTLLR